MVWGAIGRNYKSKLIFLKEKVTAEYYQQFLEENHVFEDMKNNYGEETFIFMQDGATCHTTDDNIEYINSKVRLLHGWPPNSPDMNPIEMA